MPFPKSIREDALVKSQRHCCVCHEFAGRSINVHHIKQESQGGGNTLENAIVLCLRCHAEAGHFNPNHPLGTKYSPSELTKHRDMWFEACLNGTAIYSSTVETKIKRTYTSQKLHKYVVLFRFHNGTKAVIEGWKLDVFIPLPFKTYTGEVEKHMNTIIDGNNYKKFQVQSTEVLYLGESHEITDQEWAKIEYEIDDEIFYAARQQEFKILWKFYSSAEPPITGELAWEEIQQF